jgi:uncharacterized membrane protein
MSLAARAYLAMVVFSLCGSAISKFANVDPGPIAPIASLLTIGIGILAWISPIAPHLPRKPLILALSSVLLLGASAEIASLAVGIPFGQYRYTENWWPTITLGDLGPFPIALPFAWLLITGAAYRTVATLPRIHTPTIRIIAAAALATIIDFWMEPVMTETLRYWIWQNPSPLPGSADLLNPIGWFITSLIASLIFEHCGFAQPEDPTIKKDRSPWAVLAGFSLLMAGIWIIGPNPKLFSPD